MTTDLERAFKALNDKKSVYDQLFAYYDGNQPLVYTAKRLEEIFKSLDAYFAENWCSVVIDACQDRVNLREIQASDPRVQSELLNLWQTSELNLESDEVHCAAMVAGEAYLIAWPNEQDEPEAYYNDPRLVHLFYSAEFPRRKQYAAKWWTDDDGLTRMTLYYPDRLEYYRSNTKSESVMSPNAFQPFGAERVENTYGEIPVFHFRSGQRKIKSDLSNVVPVQNGINKLLTDMMVTAEYLAFPQRFIISNADVKGKLKNAPNEIMDLPAGDGMGQQTQAGQFPAADLENYLKAIENLAIAISTITRTPKHYFFSVGSNLSGEALIAMEAPLNKKAQDRIDRFVPVWQQASAFMLKIAGLDVDANVITPVFDRPETIQPRTRAETRQMNVNAGIPLVTVLREEGWSEAKIAQMQQDKEAEKAGEQNNLARMLLDAERNFNAGGTNAV